MFKYTISLFTVLVLLVNACAKVDYVGSSYPPTNRVDVYYSEGDIDKYYRVMGHAVAHADELVSTEEAQNALIKEAREKGADGIIIFGLDAIASDVAGEYEKQIRATFIKYE